jgi:integrase/recombinase XerD
MERMMMPTKRPPIVYTDNEIARLLKAYDPATITGCRGRAMVVVLVRSGLRIQEFVDLKPSEMYADGRILIADGKGGKSRMTAVDTAVMPFVEAWRARRITEGLEQAPTLFCSWKGLAMKQSAVRNLLAHRGVKAGWDKPCRPHNMRHTFAYNLLLQGTPMQAISQALGHSSLATTARYISHIGDPQIMQMLMHREGNGGVYTNVKTGVIP